MVNLLTIIFGDDHSLNIWNMGARAVLVFLFTLILMGIAGRRSFGLQAPLDIIIVILLGSVMSRAVVGASPIPSIFFAGFVIAVLHRILALLAVYSHRFGILIKGTHILLYQKGNFIRSNMIRSLVSEHDIREVIRLKTQADSLDRVDEVYMERNGAISIVEKKAE